MTPEHTPQLHCPWCATVLQQDHFWTTPSVPPAFYARCPMCQLQARVRVERVAGFAVNGKQLTGYTLRFDQ